MLTLQNTEAIRRIEEAIGYTFNDKRLLIQVLTRKTYLKIDPEAPDNEVLEFYGDTLMNYHVTNYFMSKYAHMLDDGLFFMRTVEQFTDMRSHYVCNRYLTDRIKAMGLARYLRAQNRDSELRRDGEKAYADIFESLVGAIYLDSYQNDNLIRAFILRQLGIEPKRLPEDIEAFDYDSLTTPVFTEAPVVALEEPETLADLPAPETVPVVEVEVPAPEADGSAVEAEAVTEVIAEPAEVTAETPMGAPVEVAALSAVASAESVSVPAEPEAVAQPMQDALAAFCREWGYDQPTYGQTPPNAPNARPVAACTMKYKDAKGKLVKISLNDSGRTLAEATEKAAAKMLKKLEKQTADRNKKAAEKPAEAKPVEAVPEKTDAVAIQELPVQIDPVTEGHAEPIGAVSIETKAPVAEMPTEEPSVADVPSEDVPSGEPAEVVPVEVEAPAVEAEAVSEPVSAIEETPVAEVAPDADATAAVESVPAETPTTETAPAKEFVQQTMELPVEAAPTAETVLAEESVAMEEVKPVKAPRKRKTAPTDGTNKPARKAPARKKTTPAEDKPVEKTAETTAEAPAEAPVQEAKPRTRRPRAKKQEAVSEVSAEDGQGQAE